MPPSLRLREVAVRRLRWRHLGTKFESRPRPNRRWEDGAPCCRTRRLAARDCQSAAGGVVIGPTLPRTGLWRWRGSRFWPHWRIAGGLACRRGLSNGAVGTAAARGPGRAAGRRREHLARAPGTSAGLLVGRLRAARSRREPSSPYTPRCPSPSWICSPSLQRRGDSVFRLRRSL